MHPPHGSHILKPRIGAAEFGGFLAGVPVFNEQRADDGGSTAANASACATDKRWRKACKTPTTLFQAMFVVAV